MPFIKDSVDSKQKYCKPQNIVNNIVNKSIGSSVRKTMQSTSYYIKQQQQLSISVNALLIMCVAQAVNCSRLLLLRSGI